MTWCEYKLGEVTENFDSMRKPVKGTDRKAGSFPYYGASGIVDFVDDFIFDGEYLLIAEDGENLRTRKTPIAFIATGKYWVNNHAHIVRGNHRANTKYLSYALKVTDVSGYLTGSTMPKLTQGNMNQIRLELPEILEQERIVNVLGALDDKIENNRRMNETLEEMARAIFKSWFVDFDPVHAKAAGAVPAHMDADTAALFPSSFGDDGLPAGWGIKKLEDVMELAYGKALKASNRVEGQVPVYGSGGITGSHNEALVDGPSVIIGRKGTVGSLFWEDRPFFPIDTSFYLKPKIDLTFCYYLLQTLKLDNMNTDAAVPGLNRNNVYRLEFTMPSQNCLSEFQKVVGLMRRKIRSNSDETQTLAELRDTLLPKLMSGEIRVADAESEVEAAV